MESKPISQRLAWLLASYLRALEMPRSARDYVAQWSSGARKRNLTQIRADLLNIAGPDAEPSSCWWMRFSFMNTREQKAAGLPITASEGPIQTDGLRSMLLGRVIGYARSGL